MRIVIEGPELTLVDFDNILDIFKERKKLYFAVDIYIFKFQVHTYIL